MKALRLFVILAVLGVPSAVRAECGDIDAARGVNTVDAYHILRSVVGLGPLALADADVDCSGSIALRDALLVLRYAVTGAPPLACPVAAVFSITNATRVNALALRLHDTGYVVSIYDDIETARVECYDLLGNDGQGGFGFVEYDYGAAVVAYAVVRNLPADGPVDFLRCLVHPAFTFDDTDDVAFADALVWELDAPEPSAPTPWPAISVRFE